MSIDTLRSQCKEWLQSVQAVAAVGAALHLRNDGRKPDPRMAEILDRILREAHPEPLEDASPAEIAMLRSFIATTMRQSLDLLINPERPVGWTFDDPALLDSQGRASRIVVRGIETFAKKRETLDAVLKRPGVFLDIGTGAGWIAIEAATRWQGYRVVGIDIWEPSLALANRNVADNDLASRITIRKQGLEAVADRQCYSLIWLPGPFMPVPVVSKSLPALLQALIPGGVLIFGFYTPPPTAMARLLSELWTVRSGGHPWQQDEAEALLAASGFDHLGNHSVSDTLMLVAASRPEIE